MLRIPDDGRDCPLSPGLERFPLRHVDDVAPNLPEDHLRRGGVILPMYQSEALWIYFGSSGWRRRGAYPFAVKIGTGKICQVT